MRRVHCTGHGCEETNQAKPCGALLEIVDGCLFLTDRTEMWSEDSSVTIQCPNCGCRTDVRWGSCYGFFEGTGNNKQYVSFSVHPDYETFEKEGTPARLLVLPAVEKQLLSDAVAATQGVYTQLCASLKQAVPELSDEATRDCVLRIMFTAYSKVAEQSEISQTPAASAPSAATAPPVASA